MAVRLAHVNGRPDAAVHHGHHTAQAGKLGVLDPARGRQENSGAQLVAPVRDTPAERVDFYGQEGELFQYPFPITETEFLVGYAPLGWKNAHQAKGGADFGDGDGLTLRRFGHVTELVAEIAARAPRRDVK